MKELKVAIKKGERFKAVRELDFRTLPVKRPADLVGKSETVKRWAERYASSLKNNKKTR